MSRICLLGAAVAALFIIGAAASLAATPHASTQVGTKTTTPHKSTKLSCVTALVRQVPAGDTKLSAAELSGNQGGAAVCKPFGAGVEFEKVSTDDSGDLTGKWQQWFNTGTMFGTFTLTPSANNQPPSPTNPFGNSWTGIFVIKNGTGAYAKATGEGTDTCATLDSVHFVCKESGKFSLSTVKKA